MQYVVEGRKLLLVEDDNSLLDSLKSYFGKRNSIFTAEDVGEAVEVLRAENIDAVILDLVLKSSMGLDLFKAFSPLPPVVILSTLDGVDQIVTGLTSGAADYVTKPCSFKILETRLAIRLLPQKDAVQACGDFVINANNRTVRYKNTPITLTPSEFNILYFMVKNKGKYFLADDIYEKVWGAPSLQTTTIRAHLSVLRRKLKDVAPDVDIIHTEFGKGYCFTGEF